MDDVRPAGVRRCNALGRFFLVIGIGASLAILKRTLKVVALFLVVTVTGFSGLKVLTEKGDKPWSALRVVPAPEIRASPTPTPLPDVRLKLSVPSASSVMPVIMAAAHNPTATFVDKLRYEFEMQNQSEVLRIIQRALKYYPKDVPLSVQNRLFPPTYVRFDSYNNPDQWVKANQTYEIGPINSSRAFLEGMKRGDKLVGTALITCAQCERQHGYWIFYEVGKGGWFAETEDSSHPRITECASLLKRKRCTFG